MKRVVVTGMGITSCLGQDLATVEQSLKNGTSGIRLQQQYIDRGLRSHIAGSIDIDLSELIERKHLRFMGDAAAYAYLSMQQAIADANLADNLVSDEKTGIIIGNGGGSSHNQVQAADIAREKSVKKIGPYMVARTMCSTAVAALATFFKIRGVNYSISSACATSLHCIGNAVELIQMGKQNIMFAGGGEEESWEMTSLFDAMGALSSKYNDTPSSASRPYDKSRDGFVIAGGAGILVLEELEHALARGAKIYAEVVGYGATSDGYDMVAPSGEGATRCIKQALASVNDKVDYINTHGTSTPVGDITELNAIAEVFKEDIPTISSTKSLSGHSLGAAGVQESIYTLLMMQHNFIAASANIHDLDEQASTMNIAQQRVDNASLNCTMTTNFGFGGTNAALVYKKYTA